MAQTLLEELRIQRNLTQEQIALKANIDLNRYQDLEVGNATLKYEEAGSLAPILDVDPILLLESARTINYNIGTYSRTIYANNYYEGEEKER